jgi:hypothetical protein
MNNKNYNTKLIEGLFIIFLVFYFIKSLSKENFGSVSNMGKGMLGKAEEDTEKKDDDKAKKEADKKAAAEKAKKEAAAAAAKKASDAAKVAIINDAFNTFVNQTKNDICCSRAYTDPVKINACKLNTDDQNNCKSSFTTCIPNCLSKNPMKKAALLKKLEPIQNCKTSLTQSLINNTSPEPNCSKYLAQGAQNVAKLIKQDLINETKPYLLNNIQNNECISNNAHLIYKMHGKCCKTPVKCPTFLATEFGINTGTTAYDSHGVANKTCSSKTNLEMCSNISPSPSPSPTPSTRSYTPEQSCLAMGGSNQVCVACNNIIGGLSTIDTNKCKAEAQPYCDTFPSARVCYSLNQMGIVSGNFNKPSPPAGYVQQSDGSRSQSLTPRQTCKFMGLTDEVCGACNDIVGSGTIDYATCSTVAQPFCNKSENQSKSGCTTLKTMTIIN